MRSTKMLAGCELVGLASQVGLVTCVARVGFRPGPKVVAFCMAGGYLVLSPAKACSWQVGLRVRACVYVRCVGRTRLLAASGQLSPRPIISQHTDQLPGRSFDAPALHPCRRPVGPFLCFVCSVLVTHGWFLQRKAGQGSTEQQSETGPPRATR